MAKTVISIFQNNTDVENAIRELNNLNYDTKEMSVVMKNVEAREHIKETGVQVAEGTTSGAITGGALGGLAGLLVGIGTITLPGIGPFLAAGPIATALGLTGAAATTTTGVVTGAVTGGILGGLLSLGLPEEEAKVYEEKIRGGGILLVVPTLDERTEEVRDIVSKHHAHDVRQLDLIPK